jgi:hypothetical protein
MSIPTDLDEKLKKYTKEELILGIKEIDYKGYILTKLPIIKYNRMCDEAERISNQAQAYSNKKEFALAIEYFDKSNKLYEDANKFIDKESKYNGK